MLKRKGKLSEINHSTSDMTAEILRELKKTNGITSTLPNCDVSFEPLMCRLGFVKSNDFTIADAVMAVAIKHHENTYFENRKRRPQERGRKKRRKGKLNPIDRLWNSANSKNCSSRRLLEQD